MVQPQLSESRSTAATLAAAFGLLAPLLMAAGLAGIHLGILPPLRGFMVFLAGLLLCGLLALLFGLIGILRTGAGSGRAGRGRALFGTLAGAVLLGLLGVLAVPSMSVPRIHDITTSPEDPPAFTAAARHPDNSGRNMAYPEGAADAAALQRQAYPDIAPIRLAVPPAEAQALAKQAVGKLGWRVTLDDSASGVLEAEETSRLFHFVDDIVLRVRPAEGGSVVDVRSLSRVGKGDLGQNARRIRAFAAALRPAP